MKGRKDMGTQIKSIIPMLGGNFGLCCEPETDNPLHMHYSVC